MLVKHHNHNNSYSNNNNIAQFVLALQNDQRDMSELAAVNVQQNLQLQARLAELKQANEKLKASYLLCANSYVFLNQNMLSRKP